MTHVTCRLTAKNRDQLWNPTLCNRLPFTIAISAKMRRFELEASNRQDESQFVVLFNTFLLAGGITIATDRSHAITCTTELFPLGLTLVKAVVGVVILLVQVGAVHFGPSH